MYPILVLLFVAYLAYRYQCHESTRKARAALQFYDSDWGEVHFPSMLYFHRHEGLYEIRRKGDGTWEKKCSQYMVPYQLALRNDPSADHLTFLKNWQPLMWPEMETAYQRFIHTQDVPVIVEVHDRWTLRMKEKLERVNTDADGSL